MNDLVTHIHTSSKPDARARMVSALETFEEAIREAKAAITAGADIDQIECCFAEWAVGVDQLIGWARQMREGEAAAEALASGVNGAAAEAE